LRTLGRFDIATFARVRLFVPETAIVLVWLAAVSWRPWVLGFVHDDWLLFSINEPESTSLRDGGRTRPLYLWFHQLASLCLDDSAFGWHAVGALLVLISAFALYRFCEAVITRFAPAPLAARRAAIAGACAWMLLPWGLGYSAWPVMFPGLLSIAAFCQFAAAMVSDRSLAARLPKACIWYALCNLIYEAFWFAFVPIVVLLIALERERRVQTVVVAAAVLGVIQAVFVAWNRVLTYWGGGYGKYLGSEIISGLTTSLREIPSEMAGAMGASTLLLVMTAAMLIVAAAVMTSRVRDHRYIATIGIVVLLGTIVSAGLFAAAGYKVTGQGVFSRTTIALNVWVTLAIATFWYLLLANRLATIVVLSFAVTLAAVLSRGLFEQLLRWHRAWELELTALNRFPIHQLAGVKDPILLLADLPRTPRVVETFEAFWDITAALHHKYPGTRLLLQATVMRKGEWFSRWDGQTLYQAWCRDSETPIWTLPAPQLMVWRDQDRQISTPPGPLTIGCPSKS
jgi:hypothetical protein